MPKSDNVKKTANRAMRTAFSALTLARQHKAEWIHEENTAKDMVRALTGGVTGVTFETPDGIEVGSVNESEPVEPIDWKKFCESDYFQKMLENSGELRTEVEKHRKPASTTVTILSKYVESGQQTSRPVKRTTAAY